jgi:hypothetical protein
VLATALAVLTDAALGLVSVDGGRATSSLALVDFASICPTGDEADHADALELMAYLIRSACSATPETARTVHEVDCRIYGGFRDIAGAATERKAWLVRHLQLARGLLDGIRIVPTLVEGVACAPRLTLVGTYANGQQKMVDAMIAEDMGLFARAGEFGSILLISDDEDFVPAVISNSLTTSMQIRWLRQRSSGRNDYNLTSAVRLLTDVRWQ